MKRFIMVVQALCIASAVWVVVQLLRFFEVIG
jgi:hypothetical protein